MKKAIRNYSRDFIAIVLLFLVSLGVGGYILGNQRLYLPHWVPFVGSDFVNRDLVIQTAQSVTPGQGQGVAIAGVKVGEVAKVRLVNGQAVITMKIRRKYSTLYRNASALLRPKTGLNDMEIELDPGTARAGKAPANWKVPIDQTLPNINADEVLSALDGDTRDYLRLLLAGAGQGLQGRSRDLANAFRRFDPTNRDILLLTKGLAKRRVEIARSIHNFSLLTQAIGTKDRQLAELVDASNAVFQAFANQDSNLRQTIQLLPGTLQNAQLNLNKADRLARTLGPTLGALRPAARALGPTLQQQRPFFRETLPIIHNDLRPFARASLPTVKLLRPAARDLAAATPALTTSFKVLNEIVNELAYKPSGQPGYLFYASWASHDGMSLFATGDAHGPIRRGVFLTSCSSLNTLNTIVGANPSLGILTTLVNTATKAEACPGQAGAGSGNAPGTGPGRSVAATSGTANGGGR
jgi:phospholipid/cholesterol/gamma-HCH transport system substrate-binding protein